MEQLSAKEMRVSAIASLYEEHKQFVDSKIEYIKDFILNNKATFKENYKFYIKTPPIRYDMNNRDGIKIVLFKMKEQGLSIYCKWVDPYRPTEIYFEIEY